MPNFQIEQAKQLLESNEQFPVSLENAWQWLDYHDKSTAKRAFLACGFIDEIDFSIIAEPITTGISANPKQNLSMTVDAFKQWAMMSGTEKGKQVRLYFLECEKQLKQLQFPAVLSALHTLHEQMQRQQEQLQLFQVDQNRMNQLQQEKENRLQAAIEHPGCANILDSEEEDELTTKEYLIALGLDLRHLRTVSRRAATMQKVGTNNSPKTKRNGLLILKIQYLKEATKSVLGLD